ncbi:MAG: hypothetical protein LBC42_01255, partial [Puniceicoccales bacterium]|nr:hypothetical protein [Puniceicoccales bacterium]
MCLYAFPMAKITSTDDRVADLVKQVEQNANYRNIDQISPIHLSEVVEGEYVISLDLRGEVTFYDRVVILAHLWDRGRCMTIIIMLFARWDLL